MSEAQNSSPTPDDGSVLAILTWLATHRNAAELNLEELGQQLQALKEAPLPPEQHFKLLEILFACLSSRLETHIAQVSGASIPLTRKIRQQVNTLQDLLDKFSLAYEEASKTLLHNTATHENDPAQALERAAFCLHKHLYISYLVAAPGGLGIWKRLHGIFQLSLEHGPKPLQPYGEALLLACAQPASFSSGELDFIAGYAHPRANTLQLSDQPPQDMDGVFWIDLSRDFPAFALTRRKPPPEYQVFYFSCRPIAQLAEADLNALSRGQTAASLQLPDLAASPAGKGTLRRLVAFWGNPGKRRFPRRRQSHRATLCTGLNQIWRMLQTPDDVTEEDFSQWMITNESPDGYALMHLHGKAGRIQVGDIVAIQAETEQGSTGQWLICLVRWAISENPQHIEIGLQALAPDAIPSRLAIPSDPAHNGQIPTLLLPELPPLRNQPILVVPAGAINDQSHQLLLLIEKTNLEIRQVRALELNEQTGIVEAFTIEADAS